MAPSATRRLVGLALVACLAMAMRPALACGVFSRAMSEAEIAGKLPYLSVERVLLAWDPGTGFEDFVREVRFERASQAFGFVVPVPSTPEVSGVEGSPFDAIAAAFPFQESTGGVGGGRGRGGPVSGAADTGVTVLATKRIGSFTSFIISATDGGGLAAWLASNRFDARDAGKDWLQHYVRLGFTFVALRYDGPPAGSTPVMTSQTVRIRFRTPLPYYPYLEPAQTDAPQAPRELKVWMASPRRFVPVAAYAAASSLESEPHALDRSSEVVAFSVDGRRLLVGRGASLSAFEITTGKELWTAELEHFDGGSLPRISRLFPLRTPAPTAAGSVLVDWYSPAEDALVLSFVEVDSGRIAWRSTQEVHGANVFAVSPDGRSALAIGWNPPTARVWDVPSHSMLRELPAPATEIRSAAFLDDDRVVGEAMTLDGEALRAWDVHTAAQPLTIPIPPVNLRSLVASGDGRRIAALTDDLQLRVWDARSGKEIRSFDLFGQPIPDAITLTRDGRRLYSLDESGLYAWDVDTGHRLDCGGLTPKKVGFQSHSLVLTSP
jgi:hypothetical protein